LGKLLEEKKIEEIMAAKAQLTNHDFY